MPLKHLTETILIVSLSLVVILTGLLLSTLPALPQGLLPWILLTALALGYPASLYPLLKRTRADYLFRVLHFLPVFLALLWLLLHYLVLRTPLLEGVLKAYLFAWTLPGVLFSFLLLAFFVLHVIRRREARLTLLLLLFVPYVLLATMSEKTFNGSRQIAAVLWTGQWWNIAPPGRSSSAGSAAAVSRSSASRAASFSSVPYLQSSSSSRPARLPSAGFGLNLLAVTLGALYMGTLHRRAKMNVSNR